MEPAVKLIELLEVNPARAIASGAVAVLRLFWETKDTIPAAAPLTVKPASKLFLKLTSPFVSAKVSTGVFVSRGVEVDAKVPAPEKLRFDVAVIMPEPDTLEV